MKEKIKKIKSSLPVNQLSDSLGGGILVKGNSEGFKRLKKNKKQKRIIIGSIVGILIVIGSITLYKTFALYKEEKTFNVIRGQVPEFSPTDLELLSFTLDGNSIETAPSRGAYDVSITCNNGAQGYWDYEKWGPQIKNINKKTKCSVSFTTGKYMSDYIISLSSSNVSHVEKIEHEETVQTPALTDYRYVGSDEEVNNYVYFGCSDNCTEDNLYRIIGVIPTQSTTDGEYEQRVKLIKANYYMETSSGLLHVSNTTYPAPGGYGYQWNNSLNNKWESSTLQQNVLNGVYWNFLGKYQKYISPTVWYLGAPNYNGYTTYTSNQFYSIERGNTKGYSGGATSMTTNIGLMYPSDYGYSLGSGYREESVYNNAEYVSSAWLYSLENKYYEWTMTPDSSDAHAWHLHPAVNVSYTYVNDSNAMWGIRPTFYLSEEVICVGGTGSKENPYRIAI